MTACCVCGLDVSGLIECAHVPDRKTAPDNTVDLCCTCHRAFDLGLLTQEEIEAARDTWQADGRAAYAGQQDELWALWRSREADWSRLQKGAQKRGGRTLRRKAASRRAAITQREKRLRERD